MSTTIPSQHWSSSSCRRPAAHQAAGCHQKSVVMMTSSSRTQWSLRRTCANSWARMASRAARSNCSNRAAGKSTRGLPPSDQTSGDNRTGKIRMSGSRRKPSRRPTTAAMPSTAEEGAMPQRSNLRKRTMRQVCQHADATTPQPQVHPRMLSHGISGRCATGRTTSKPGIGLPIARSSGICRRFESIAGNIVGGVSSRNGYT